MRVAHSLLDSVRVTMLEERAGRHSGWLSVTAALRMTMLEERRQ